MPQQDLEAPERPGPCFLSSFSHQFYRPLQLSPHLSLHSMMQPMYIYNVGSFYFWLLLQACFSAWNNLSLSQTKPCSVPLTHLADSYTSIRSLLRCSIHGNLLDHSSSPNFWLNIYLWFSLIFYTISAVLCVSFKFLTELQPLGRSTVSILSASPVFFSCSSQ